MFAGAGWLRVFPASPWTITSLTKPSAAPSAPRIHKVRSDPHLQLLGGISGHECQSHLWEMTLEPLTVRFGSLPVPGVSTSPNREGAAHSSLLERKVTADFRKDFAGLLQNRFPQFPINCFMLLSGLFSVRS